MRTRGALSLALLPVTLALACRTAPSESSEPPAPASTEQAEQVSRAVLQRFEGLEVERAVNSLVRDWSGGYQNPRIDRENIHARTAFAAGERR